MDPKLLDDFVEEFFLHRQGFAQRLLRLGLCTKGYKFSIQQWHGRVIPTEEEVMGMTVSIRVHQNGATRFSVAPSAADLLVIPFQTAWQGGVNHGSDIRLIDPHTERRGCHHDVQLARHEFFLHLPPSLGIQSGMVYGYGKLACPLFRQSVSLLARRGVHDGWAVFVFEQDLPSELRPLRRQSFYKLDADVFAAKNMDEVCGLSQAQLSCNVVLDQRRCCGCYEWTDHESSSTSCQSRQLVTKRLARAGRHDKQRVFSRGYRPTDGFLVRAKLGEAERVLQKLGEACAVEEFLWTGETRRIGSL